MVAVPIPATPPPLTQVTDAPGGAQDVYQRAPPPAPLAPPVTTTWPAQKAVPGVPGEDSQSTPRPPRPDFACDGQVDGGYYADPEAECQVTTSAPTDRAALQVLLPLPQRNPFNQNYFICDWWFNSSTNPRPRVCTPSTTTTAAERGGHFPPDPPAPPPQDPTPPPTSPHRRV